ncbi:MAG: hypothetical protein PHX52_01725 [Candidatus Pacebacteria bacterium]|nr:hypothetical protein [Candidatus Paceibacterota bacterium]
MNNNFPYIIVSVVLIVLSVILFYFLVLPQVEKINEQKQEIIDLQYKLENTTEYFENIEITANKLNELGWSDLSDKIDANFMDGPFYTHNMEEYLSGLVTRSGLFLKSLDIEGGTESYEVAKGSSATDSAVKQVNVSFSLSGDYEYFLRFLDLLNRQALVISIKNVEISNGGTSGELTSEEGQNVYGSTFLNFQVKGTIPSK